MILANEDPVAKKPNKFVAFLKDKVGGIIKNKIGGITSLFKKSAVEVEALAQATSDEEIENFVREFVLAEAKARAIRGHVVGSVRVQNRQDPAAPADPADPSAPAKLTFKDKMKAFFKKLGGGALKMVNNTVDKIQSKIPLAGLNSFIDEKQAKLADKLDGDATAAAQLQSVVRSRMTRY